MKRRILFIALFLFSASFIFAQKEPGHIRITLKGNFENFPDPFPLVYQPVEQSGLSRTTITKSISEDPVWQIDATESIYFRFDNLVSVADAPSGLLSWYILDPGDDITITFSNNNLLFSGSGSEKLRLKNKLNLLSTKVKKPSITTKNFTQSVDDYLEWHNYLKAKWQTAAPLFEEYRDSISSLTCLFLKIDYIKTLESERHDKFNGLLLRVQNNTIDGVTRKNLCDIYDSTFFTPEACWMRIMPFGTIANPEFIMDQIHRQQNFSDYLSTPGGPFKYLDLAYEQAKKAYVGWALENSLAWIVKKTIDYERQSGESSQLLFQYFSEPRLSEYKNLVKDYLNKPDDLKIGQQAPKLSLSDLRGQTHTLNDYKGKLILLSFSELECKGCIKTQLDLEKLVTPFLNDTNFRFINITDSDNKKIVGTTTPNTIYLFADEKDKARFKNYILHDRPALYLIDADGRIRCTSLIDPPAPQALRCLIKKELFAITKSHWAAKNDGPYLLEENTSLKAWTFTNLEPTENIHKSNTPLILKSNTDLPDEYFTVKLKSHLDIEPSVFDQPHKLMAVSDLEGNFDDFRMLLQANRVIDSNFKWVFEDGHLVIAGDIFDRGNQVTECLWLIYSLEEQAKAAGGYVHFILGNHEIMNLSGDLRYTQKKYTNNARILNKDYSKDLYGKNSELGKWLRTKNIVEKIGNLLFVHGGISEELNKMALPIDSINSMARPFYDKQDIARTSTDKLLSVIYNPELSPFWYRNYYLKKQVKFLIGDRRVDSLHKTKIEDINAILLQYGVHHIITGHTIFKGNNMSGENISIHYDGKVINLNTNHHNGWSEGLLIEGIAYYRVNKEGLRFPLSTAWAGTTNSNLSSH